VLLLVPAQLFKVPLTLSLLVGRQLATQLVKLVLVLVI
jgi:hypothetical protein